MGPYLVFSLANSVLYKYLHKNTPAKVFTPTLGWGSYFYGFAETGRLQYYTGIDVISTVCKKIGLFAKRTYPNIPIEIVCSPSEDVFMNSSFIKNHKEKYNIVYFSPPYYRLELYEGNMQSTTRYDNYEEWLSEYWEKTVKLCHLVLEKNGIMCYILSGYGSEEVRDKKNIGGISEEKFKELTEPNSKSILNFPSNSTVNWSSPKLRSGESMHLSERSVDKVQDSNNKSYNLIKDMNDITKKYFKFIKMYNMYNKNVNSTKHAKTNEKIIIFQK
jgi:hypothetical protein